MSCTISTAKRQITLNATVETGQRHLWSTAKKRRIVNTSQTMAKEPMSIPSRGPTPVAKPTAGATKGNTTYVSVHLTAEISIDRWKEPYAEPELVPAGLSGMRRTLRTTRSAFEREAAPDR